MERRCEPFEQHTIEPERYPAEGNACANSTIISYIFGASKQETTVKEKKAQPYSAIHPSGCRLMSLEGRTRLWDISWNHNAKST
jgi:hypothetical protein